MVLWLTFAASLVAIIAATVVVVVRGVRLWRIARTVGSRLSNELDQVAAASNEIQTHIDAADASATRLREASERLNRSRARLEVQLEALREARTLLRRLRPSS